MPDGENWKPKEIVPASQFAEADGLFELVDGTPIEERTTTAILDVILVAPNLENAHKTWEFKQDGIDGTIRAIMKDDQFLAALETKRVNETIRTNIPMKVKLEIKQQNIDGEWKVKPKGRSVVKVISPSFE